MKKNAYRVGRIADQIQKDIMHILRHEVKDPRVQWVTVNDVEVTHDYSVAQVYWTIFDENKRDETTKALESSRGLIRSILAKGFKTYTIPQLKFIYDESLERGAKILDLISKVNSESEDESPNDKAHDDE